MARLLKQLLALLVIVTLTGCAATPAAGNNIGAASTVIATAALVPPRATPSPGQPSATTAPTVTSISLPVVITPRPTQPPGAPRRYGYRVINSYPHDQTAFTQGLVYHEGALYEGTGLYGRSSLRRVELASGKVLLQRSLAPELFGEGITLLNGKIYQLTWQSQIGFVYEAGGLGLLSQFNYPHEGWGITHDNLRLIVSDGTATIRFWNPETLTEVRRIEVRDRDMPLTNLNELEYIDGLIYANVWQTDRIVQIDPQSGVVVGEIDLSGLLGPEDRTQPVDVLNGIAYDKDGKRLFVTGKLWPKLFEIELVVE